MEIKQYALYTLYTPCPAQGFPVIFWVCVSKLRHSMFHGINIREPLTKPCEYNSTLSRSKACTFMSRKSNTQKKVYRTASVQDNRSIHLDWVTPFHLCCRDKKCIQHFWQQQHSVNMIHLSIRAAVNRDMMLKVSGAEAVKNLLMRLSSTDAMNSVKSYIYSSIKRLQRILVKVCYWFVTALQAQIDM